MGKEGDLNELGEVFFENDVANVITLDTGLKLVKHIAGLKGIMREGEVIQLTREDTKTKVIVDETFEKVLEGIIMGTASELSSDGHKSTVRRIFRKNERSKD